MAAIEECLETESANRLTDIERTYKQFRPFHLLQGFDQAIMKNLTDMRIVGTMDVKLLT